MEIRGKLGLYRAWTINSDLKLLAHSGSYEWEPGKNIAECSTLSGRKDNKHIAPMKDCRCGFNSYFELDEAIAHMMSHDCDEYDVVGLVAGWGEVEVHRNGARLQYAQPIALLIPDDTTPLMSLVIRDVARRYSIPWMVNEYHLKAYAEEHNLIKIPKECLPVERESKVEGKHRGLTTTSVAAALKAVYHQGALVGQFASVPLLSGTPLPWWVADEVQMQEWIAKYEESKRGGKVLPDPRHWRKVVSENGTVMYVYPGFFSL